MIHNLHARVLPLKLGHRAHAKQPGRSTRSLSNSANIRWPKPAILVFLSGCLGWAFSTIHRYKLASMKTTSKAAGLWIRLSQRLNDDRAPRCSVPRY